MLRPVQAGSPEYKLHDATFTVSASGTIYLDGATTPVDNAYYTIQSSDGSKWCTIASTAWYVVVEGTWDTMYTKVEGNFDGPFTSEDSIVWCVWTKSYYDDIVSAIGNISIAVIRVTTGANGTASPSGDVLVFKGESKTITFQPNSGYIVDTVTVDGTPVGAVKTYTFDNVQANHTIAATFKVAPVYTITITPANETTSASGVVITSTVGDVSTQAARLAIIKATARHCLLPAGGFNNITYLDENNLGKDTEGNSVTLDGSAGDVMLEIDPWWWTCSMVGGSPLIRISPSEIEGGYTAHLWNGLISPHLYIGVFEGNTRTRGGATCLQSGYNSAVPANYETCDTLTTYARNNGVGMVANTYNIVTGISWVLLQSLSTFVYGVLNFQDKVAQGYSTGGYDTSCLHANTSNFSLTGGWTQGAPGSNVDCTILGIKNLFAHIWEFRGGVIYNAGNLTIMRDQSLFGQISIGTTAARALGWEYFATGLTTALSASYIMSVSGDQHYPFFPETGGGSSATYFCDGAWSEQSDDRSCAVGGNCYYGAVCGLFAARVRDGLSYISWSIGARLQALAPPPT